MNVVTDAPILIEGTCDPPSPRCARSSRKTFRDRGEVGAAVCVYQDGRKVVDLWGGHKDLERTVPWAEDTIVIMNSVAKSMCALCTHILIDRGLIDFDAPVARYWPEFAAAGKEGVLVRHVLSHTCGVIYCDHAPPGSWFDWKVHIRALEQQEPAWEPGTEGRLQLDQHRLHPGRDRAARDRQERRARSCARKSPASSARTTTSACSPTRSRASPTCIAIRRTRSSRSPPTTSTPLGRAFRSAPKIGYFQNCREIRELEVASFGGHGSARAMARIYAMLAGDGAIDGVRAPEPRGGRARFASWCGRTTAS